MFELRKIGIVRRASALLLDLILLAVLATGFMFIISLICNFRGAEELATEYHTAYEDFRKEYFADVADHYGYTYEEDGNRYIIKNGESTEVSENELMSRLEASNGEDEEMKEAYDAFKALPATAAQVNRQDSYVYNLLFMTISLGILLSYLILEFILPIILKNGQTVGKKVFGICLVRPNCVKITTLSLFARTILGKYAIETMFPTLLIFLFFGGVLGKLAIVLLAALLLLNIILFFALKNRTPIHDILAGTVAVDMRIQMIFQSEEELAQKKALQQKEFIEKSEN